MRLTIRTRVGMLLVPMLILAVALGVALLRSHLRLGGVLRELEASTVRHLQLLRFDILVNRRSIEFFDVPLAAEEEGQLVESSRALAQVSERLFVGAGEDAAAAAMRGPLALLRETEERVRRAGEKAVALRGAPRDELRALYEEERRLRDEELGPRVDRLSLQASLSVERGLDRLLADASPATYVPLLGLRRSVLQLGEDVRTAREAARFAREHQRVVNEIQALLLAAPDAGRELYHAEAAARHALRHWEERLVARSRADSSEAAELLLELHRLRSFFHEEERALHAVQESAAAGRIEDALRIYAQDFEPVADGRLRDAIDDVLTANEVEIVAALERLSARLRLAGMVAVPALTAAVGFALLIPWLLSRGLWGPVLDLSRAARTMATGDLSPRVPVDRQDEIGELAARFNAMAEGLAAAQERLRRREEELFQAQKLEAVGQLAGGIAHDFNNLLTVIRGYTELLIPRLAGDEKRDAEEVLAAAERASELTQDLLAVGRRQPLEPRNFDLNAMLHRMEPLLVSLLGEDVELELRLDCPVAVIHADPGRIEQILLNLATNARDAMPEGGRLVMGTRQAEAGRYVTLSVRDTGCGMEAEVRARALEPFFTTKGPGRGTGLGLSSVYGIVHQTGGQLRLESEAGKGTCFEIDLPRARLDRLLAEDSRPGRGSRGDAGRQVSRPRRVLLVEDEAGVRQLSRRILEGAGYEVVEAADGQTALGVASDCAGPIDALVTDLVMPRLGGFELARRLREKHPGLPVVYVSGYAPEQAVPEAWSARGEPPLRKPYAPEELLGRLQRALDD